MPAPNLAPATWAEETPRPTPDIRPIVTNARRRCPIFQAT